MCIALSFQHIYWGNITSQLVICTCIIMEKHYNHEEFETLKQEVAEIKTLLQSILSSNIPDGKNTNNKKTLKNVKLIENMHPDKHLSEKMEELCHLTEDEGCTGMVTYLGVFTSGKRQSNWIKNHINTDDLLTLIENHTAQKILKCIGNQDRLNILLAILKKPMSVTELVAECHLNSTGQAYHHMKPLLAADLITEDEQNNIKGIYIIQPHRVQGIIMLLTGICDMVDETFTKGYLE